LYDEYLFNLELPSITLIGGNPMKKGILILALFIAIIALVVAVSAAANEFSSEFREQQESKPVQEDVKPALENPSAVSVTAYVRFEILPREE
jgi:hypothetical protein